jgi:arylsulfatase B
MMKKLAAILFLCWSFVLPAQAATNNILFIISDDMGIDNAGFLRTTVRSVTTPPTPNLPELQALANQGLTFTRAWATPWCSPTRISVMTGRYPFRHGVGIPIDQAAPQMANSETTLPEVIGAAPRNYLTRHIGKWHITDDNDGPRTVGWDSGVITTPTNGGFPSPQTYFSWEKFTNGTRSTENTYSLTFWVNEAIATSPRTRCTRATAWQMTPRRTPPCPGPTTRPCSRPWTPSLAACWTMSILRPPP